MRCPNCGEVLEDGKLLCESCGAEINVVPDYDFEIENEIEDALSKMALEFAKEQDNVDDFEDENADNVSVVFQNLFSKLFYNNKKIICGILGVLIIIIGIFLFNWISNSYKENSYSYQYSKAIECASTSHYEEAVVYLERALAIESDNMESRFLLAKYYEKCGRTQSAVTVLNEVLRSEESLDIDFRDEVYDYLLGLYLERQEYTDMGILLAKCDIPRIVNKYNKYAALPPEFNKDEGVYDEVISIALKGNTSGLIYYTIDGSIPTTNSSVYDTPITLESGDYIIKALFVNMYGVSSDIVTRNYSINLLVPTEPTINLESGVFNTPQFIEVYHNEKTKIFYTLDGKEPTSQSIRYTEPIEMPYGMSNFAIVAINEAGLSSNVVRRTFTLQADANFSDTLAIEVLKNNLIVSGEIKDKEGHLKNKLGINTYDVKSLVEINSKVYYIIKETYIDTINKEHDTNNLFAVDCETCDIFRASKLLEGKYRLEQF